MCNQRQLQLSGKVVRIFPADTRFHDPQEDRINGGTPFSPLVAGGDRGGPVCETEGVAIHVPSSSEFTLTSD